MICVFLKVKGARASKILSHGMRHVLLETSSYYYLMLGQFGLHEHLNIYCNQDAFGQSTSQIHALGAREKCYDFEVQLENSSLVK